MLRIRRRSAHALSRSRANVNTVTASDSDGNATIDAEANPATKTQPLSNQTAEADSVAEREISAQTATDSCYGNA